MERLFTNAAPFIHFDLVTGGPGFIEDEVYVTMSEKSLVRR